MNQTAVRPPINATEEIQFCRIATQAFNVAVSHWETVVGLIGRDNLRVIVDGGEVVGGLGFYPAHQWFGGDQVSMAAIAMVAVAPERRGRGFAFTLLGETLAELREARFAIAT